jgi:dTMP kinase
MSSPTGKLIAIEGLEGAGKSTALKTIVEVLTSLNIKTITTREPGGTAIGEQIRTIIKDPQYKEVLDDRSELLLLYTARVQLIKQVIKPALAQGSWVIADRFELSTMAYQGGGRGMDKTIIQQLSAFCLQGFKPDLTLYLDISPEQGLQRVKMRGAFDRIELQAIDFFYRVHETYLQAVEASPNMLKIAADQSIDEVQLSIKKVLHDFIENKS